MKKIAKFIVKFHKFFIFLFGILSVLCALSISRVNIEYSITSYLPQSTDTKQALDIMDEEFVTYGTSTILIRNISYEDAKKVADEITELQGVKDLPFENTTDYYSESSALFTITYDGTDEDAQCVEAYNKVIEMLEPYDALVASPLVDNYADQLQADINKILIVVIIIIVIVLIFTSQSFAEVIVFLMVFGVSALLQMGTNFFLGTISFVSNSVCVILQLALAIDYAIILSHRFAEEKQAGEGIKPADAMVEALSKGIPEIFGSSLTTIAGLLALCCMSLGLGADLGICLAKSIICSMVTVFLLMPALMLLFSKLIDKTTHKNFVPKISGLGKGILKIRHVLPVLFIALCVGGGILSFRVSYCYSQGSIDTSKPTESMVATEEIDEIFGSKNQFVILVPKGDYTTEAAVVEEMKKESMINDITAISDVSIYSNGLNYTLTQKINYKDLADFIGVSDDTAKQFFTIYSYMSNEDLNDLAVFEANPEIYRTSLLDFIDCAIAHDDFISAYLYDSPDTLETWTDVRDQIKDAEDQLVGTNYTRIVCNIDGETESSETFALIDRLKTNVKGICPGAIFAGDSMASYDLNSSFSTDNLKISILTIVFVYLILMFTANSWGIPLLQVATIQGAIFINFAFPVLTSTNLYFFVYLIVSSIQMGATIDYAIVITGRYGELCKVMDKKKAVIETLNQCFPTIVTSGTILTSAGFLIYFMVSDPLISTLGLALGRGTLVSIASVMCVLPVLLYFFYDKLEKTRLPKFDPSKIDIRNVIKELADDAKKDVKALQAPTPALETGNVEANNAAPSEENNSTIVEEKPVEKKIESKAKDEKPSDKKKTATKKAKASTKAKTSKVKEENTNEEK